jgi:predicted TPR repeat methyltransferase
MELAIQTHRHGHLIEAETLYSSILQVAPQYSPALQGLGRLLHQRGYRAQALLLLQTAVRLAPNDAACWYALGDLLHHQHRLEDAVLAFQQAIALQPDFVDALCSLGNLLFRQGRTARAIKYYCQAVVADPKRNKSRAVLGIGYSALGRLEEAAEVYRQWLQEEPENPTAAHLYAACSGKKIPVRAADHYIETTFDEFAATFDEQLLEHLSYQAPALIKAALAKALPSARLLCGLDAGCGTGLCGPVIEPYVSHLTGVDLSSNMLALAQQRQVYNDLKKAELTGYLATQVAMFDLIVMADTLIYFGALEKVFAAAYRALRCESIFIFTVENTDSPSSGQSYDLNFQGRYRHDRDYICSTLTDSGFVVSAMVVNNLRLELGKPVEGTVFTAIKAAKD